MKYGRKITGGRYKKFSKKKKYALPSFERKVKLGEIKRKKIRMFGGNKKIVFLSANYANVFDSKSKKSKKVKIKNVLETPSNRFLARENVLVKSAIIETELGKARITNRPSQEGTVNAVLME